MNKRKTSTLATQVMQQIKSGQISMKPKYYFLLISLLLGVGLAGVLSLASIFVFLVGRHVSRQQPFAFLDFGSRGIPAFLETFPWFSLSISIVMFILGLWLLIRNHIVYKVHIAGIVSGVLAFIVVLALFIHATQLGERVQHLQQVISIDSQESSGSGWVMGKVVAAEVDRLTIETEAGEEFVVIYDENTYTPAGNEFTVGNNIRSVGEWIDGTFRASGIGIRKMNGEGRGTGNGGRGQGRNGSHEQSGQGR